ncbi:DUF1533 domain-containing protein [Syntrophomonas curvata]
MQLMNGGLKPHSSKLMACLVALIMLFSGMGLGSPGSAWAKTDESQPAQSLIVNILNPDGTTTLVHDYSYEELEVLEETEYYATIDAMPTGVGTKAKGVKIGGLITDAQKYNPDIKWESGRKLVFYVTDAPGYPYQGTNYYTYDFLYGQERYYFPNLVETYDPEYGREAIDLTGAVPVEPMLASSSYQERGATDAILKNEASPVAMEGRESFRFCMGITEAEARDENFSSTNKFGRWIYRVDVGPVNGPKLKADTTGNEVGQPIEITFTDNSAWRAAISSVKVNDSVLTGEQYAVAAGKITINPGVFAGAGEYTVTVEASGFMDSTVKQTILKQQVAEPQAQYKLTPLDDEVYVPGETPDGIKTMTVNAGLSGIKYFTVNVDPVLPHEGLETVVFSHWRDDVQLTLNAIRADFDVVREAQAGFNVQPGDIIKAYVVDQLSNDADRNPVPFH